MNVTLKKLACIKKVELGPPATQEQITEAENRLKVEFPEEYREFLGRYSYALWDGNYVAGISESKTLSTVLATEYRRRLGRCPVTAIVLDTDYVMFCNPSPTYLITNSPSVASPDECFEWTSFFDWLQYKMSL
ncbi:MAG TPA: SMI1/KNR4 family protein [Verrucomicrobiales bacterium]|jgi:hypothetical protein|nr:SMI1/KNR4 family protein [Verrucomicrobiales bacterium]